MEYTVSAGGLLVHARGDWPCAMCRPQNTSERRGLYLCIRCAHSMIAATEAGVEGARALLDDITDALVMLETPNLETQIPAN